MNRERRILVLRIGVIFLLLLLIVIFRHLLWRWLVQPAAFVLWALWRVLASVDQIFYWFLLIGIALLLLIRRLPNEPQENSAYANHGSIVVKGTAYWQDLIQTASRDEVKRQIVRRDLEKMLINGLILQEHSDRDTIKLKLAEKGYPFPAFVYAYFYPDEKNWRYRLKQSLRQSGWAFPGWLQPDKMKYQHTIQTILIWMEETLEVPFYESAES